MQELQDALRDWERYQRIPREQFFSDRDTRNMVFYAILHRDLDVLKAFHDTIQEDLRERGSIDP